MNLVVRNIIAVVVGAVIGGVINGVIINFSGKIIPPPNGADLTTMEGLKSSMHLFEPINFLMPFLAHALGTLFGAMVTCFIAGSNHLKLALLVAVLFFIGGITNVMMLPAPMWFNVTDLLLAYIPMGFLGWKLSKKGTK